LENVLERSVINPSGPKLRLIDDLAKPYKRLGKNQKTLDAVERDYIIRVLNQTNWKVNGKNSTSQILGLNRSTLRARMRKLDIVKPDSFSPHSGESRFAMQTRLSPSAPPYNPRRNGSYMTHCTNMTFFIVSQGRQVSINLNL